MDILDLARRNQQKARKIIEDTKIIPIWESIGARVNLVGSLSTGLLMKHLDIDSEHRYISQRACRNLTGIQRLYLVKQRYRSA